jgi:hypothetical protein
MGQDLFMEAMESVVLACIQTQILVEMVEIEETVDLQILEVVLEDTLAETLVGKQVVH